MTGSNFVGASQVRWNGAARATTFVSATQLTAAITAADVAAAGTAQVTVLTPAPGGGTSAPLGFAINPGSTINVGLAGYWPFDAGSGATATDASGGGNAGVLLNGPIWTTGRSGQALSFDGVDDAVQVAHTASLNGYPLTVAAWIRTGSTTGVSGLVAKTLAGFPNGWALYLSGGNLCATYYRDAANRLDDGSGCPLRTAGFADNQWHHVAYVVDASGGRLYVDGVQRAVLGWTGTAGAASTTQPLQVGRYPGAPAPEFLAGLVDDVRVYGRGLSAAEAMELYTNFGAVSDTVAPVISALAVTGITPSGATVTWTTNEPSDTQADYGRTSAYGTLTSIQPTLVTAHVQGLGGLSPGTTYFVRVLSRDFAGNLAVSGSVSFRTSDPGAAATAAAPARAARKKKGFFEEIFGFLF